jgi:hypothetical protein
MDAVKFIEERNRMCKSFGPKCKGCPASNANEDELWGCAVAQESTLDATAQIAIVEEWSAAHPRKTRQSVFLEQYPESFVDESGVLMLCPRYISEELRNSDGMCKEPGKHCVDCSREFWMQEVE